MTHLYTRPGGRAPIHWEPDQPDLGRQAVESVVGAPDSYPADVTDEEAEQIREKYQQLLEQQ